MRTVRAFTDFASGTAGVSECPERAYANFETSTCKASFPSGARPKVAFN